MPDTVKIVATINKGFEAMNAKIDKKFAQCDERLTDVETEIIVKKALCKERKKVEEKAEATKKDKRDYWKFIIRAVSIAGIFALASIAWEKIKAVLDLVP